jgi:putative transposase
MLIDIRSSFEKSDRTYGSPRILKDLRELGQQTSKNRIARIMKENGIVAVQRRRFKVTTQSGHDYPIYQNLLDRNFAVDDLNRVWLGDTTYIKTEEGWLYLESKKKRIGSYRRDYERGRIALFQVRLSILTLRV